MKTLITRIADDRTTYLRQVPDSALLYGGRPLFLPENSAGAHLHVMPAVRISRLGLAIGRKFASRYYDAATLVALNCINAPESADDADLVADNALVVGTWTDVPADGLWHVTAPDGQRLDWNLQGEFDNAVACLSRRSTFKTGDIVVLGAFSHPATTPQNSRPQWALNGNVILNFKIK